MVQKENTMTNRKILVLAITLNTLSLIALLGYSLERTAWLFARFETDTVLPVAAAVVVEIAAVALLVGAGAIAQLDRPARAWANRALGAVLSVQALANLSAGYLRGGHATLALFAGDNPNASYAVAAALWLSVNLAVPALIFFLSKLLERLIGTWQHASDAPLREQLVSLRTESARLTEQSAALRIERDQARTQAFQVRMLIDQGDAESAQVRNELEQVRSEAAKEHATLEEVRRQSAAVAHENERLRAMVRTHAEQADQLSAENAALSAVAAIDVRTIAQTLRSRDVPLRTIGDALRVNEKTIRNWTADVRTNGHMTEEEA